MCVYIYLTEIIWQFGIFLFPLDFKAEKSMFPIMCAEGLCGAYEHRTWRQARLRKQVGLL